MLLSTGGDAKQAWHIQGCAGECWSPCAPSIQRMLPLSHLQPSLGQHETTNEHALCCYPRACATGLVQGEAIHQHESGRPMIQAAHDARGNLTLWFSRTVLPSLATCACSRCPDAVCRRLGSFSHRCCASHRVKKAASRSLSTCASIASQILFYVIWQGIAVRWSPNALARYAARKRTHSVAPFSVVCPAIFARHNKPISTGSE